MPPILAVLLSLVAPPAQTTCLAYEPSTVTIEGVIKRQTFAGPPSFESIADGDQPMVYWILHLDRPICVDDSPLDNMDVAEKDVARVQLILDEHQYRRYKPLVGQRVRASGTLMHQINGHHVETLLLTVSVLEALTPQK